MSETSNHNAQNPEHAAPWSSLEPYVQLVRSLLPRATGIALFDADGELRWSSDTLTGPDLPQAVANSLGDARRNPSSQGTFYLLGGSRPAYLCWLRDDEQRLIAAVAVLCRAATCPEPEARNVNFALSLLRPVLECLRRDLLSRATIERLSRVVNSLDKTREALVSDGALSGLYTRPAFEQRMRSVAADTNGARQWTALYIDADQLHVINDSFGMHVGDNVLAGIGDLIRKRIPADGFAARISGDRFAILLPMTLEMAEKFAESLRASVERVGATSQADSKVHVSISVGVASLSPGDAELMHSLAAAETACKAAKDRGRNRVEVYQCDDASIVRRFTDINIAGQLREAIDTGHLRLDAQLIAPFARARGARPHFELLLRMLDENGHAVTFDRLLSAANRYQLMPVIDRWVIDSAISLLRPRAQQLATKGIGFAINFSGQSLNDDEFPRFLLDRVRQSGLDPSMFCFELTENATATNIDRAESLMRQLRELGCGVALDDFGTGVSSLSFLRRLPVTMLKIDGSFIRDVLTDSRAESMVRSIAQLARTMSIATVAEYVETREICARVAVLGVDYGQGFAIGRPTPLTDLLAGLRPLMRYTPQAPAETPLAAEPKRASSGA
jgi:diguanylate cyclase (GGDEF)-like protein